MTGQFLNTREAASYLKVSASLLNKLRLTGGGPPYMKLGPKRVVYDVGDLNAWMCRKRFVSEFQL
ncbi:helix-turn-helix domain-containing protein [Microvirga aerilata]|uniref:Helix-turn-helix domain-containing protein n=1 Tax=Microvirga aerilata TaxID=670292 RepID=A0A936ZCY2_9HYPH|nr:helix-turn-helix domain-containing protein [Microvirga aerilata]